MSVDREKILKMALKALLAAAQECFVDIDELTEAAIQSMLSDKTYDAEDVAEAAIAIEVAADSLQVIH